MYSRGTGQVRFMKIFNANTIGEALDEKAKNTNPQSTWINLKKNKQETSLKN